MIELTHWLTDYVSDLTARYAAYAWLWQNPGLRVALLLVLGAVVVAMVLPGGKPAQRYDRRQPDEDVKRATNTPLWRRLWWKLRPPHDVMRVDGLVIDRTRKLHCLWVAPTGGGKSASVATVRVDGKRPTLIVTPDLSDPMIEATLRQAGFIWTACQSRVPVNFLIGSPTEVAERLTEVFRSGGVGAWKRTARRATAQVIRDMDAAGETRSLKLIGEWLQETISADRELKTVCAGWVARFLDLADQFGPSIGVEGKDLAELLNAGRTVLLDNDSFDHSALGGDVVALGLAEAKRCASLVPGGFRLIFEEAGQLGERIDLAEPFFRAGRRRKIAVDVLTQAESDLNEGISANIATRFYFGQELKSLQKVAADRLGLDYRRLDPANMADFTAWAAHGRIRRLVKFPKPAQVTRPDADGLIESSADGRNGRTEGKRRYRVVELKPGRGHPGGVLALPPPSTGVQRLLKSIYPEGECERWAGKHDKDGYGLVWLDGKWQKVHRVRWELAYGRIPLNADGTVQTIDHQRTCEKDCSRLSHLTLCTRGENSKRRWRVRGVGTAEVR